MDWVSGGGGGDRDAESGWRVGEAGNGWRPGYLTVHDCLGHRVVMHSEVWWPWKSWYCCEDGGQYY